MKRKLLLLLVALLPMAANAFDAYIDGIYYNFFGNEATVTPGDYKYSGDVVLPESVIYNGQNYRVTTIDSYSFYECSGLISITIPTTLKMVGANAFEGCI